MNDGSPSKAPEKTSQHVPDATALTPAFIVTTGEMRHDASVQRFIKSHVMRNSHRERRLKQQARRGTPARRLAPVSNPERTVQRAESEGEQRAGGERVLETGLLTPGSTPQQEDFETSCYLQAASDCSTVTRYVRGHDPFNILPIQSTARTHAILYNSRAHTFRTSIYAGTREFTLNLASSSPSLTWTVLCVEAYMQAFPYRSFVPESAAYLQKAIGCINYTLSQRSLAHDDATIATVTHFSNFEVMYGNAVGAATHIAGLCTMIRLRGGLEKLSPNGVLRRWVVWSALLASTRFETPPRITPLPLSSAARIHLSSFLEPSKTIPRLTPSTHLISRLEEANCLGLLSHYKTVHELAFFLDATSFLPHPKSEAILLEAKYHDRVSAVEYDVLTLLNQHPDSTDSNTSDNIARIFLLAALLYIYDCLRLTRSAIGIRISLASRLQKCLEKLKNEHGNLRNELLWVYFLSATTCGPESRGWFLNHIRDQCRYRGLTSWREVKSILNKGGWLEIGTWKACNNVWKEIDGIDGTIGVFDLKMEIA